MEIQQFYEKDLDEVFSLYRAALGEPGCVWNENYPDRELIKEDIEKECLYGLRDEKGKILASIALDRDEEIDSLPCWDSQLLPAAELARLVVAKEYQNKSVARLLITEMEQVLKRKGYQSVHYLVAQDNTKARRSYAKLHFSYKGETDLWGHHYLCYEKEL